MMIHRIAASEYHASLHEIKHTWGLGDIADAHRFLNYQKEVEAIQQQDMDDIDPPRGP